MIGFFLRRLAWSVLVLWFVVSASFAMVYAIPADPARALVGPHGDAETIVRVRQTLCLDRPFVAQYGCFVGRVMRGDFGTSFRTQRPVATLLIDHIWPTVQLAVATVLLQIVLGLPLGVIAAMRHNRLTDYIANMLALIGQSAPTFFLGPLFMYLLAFRLGWFPLSGYGEGGWDRLLHLFLPAFTMAVAGMAYYMRLMRDEMITALREDYVRTARAKGLSMRAVIWKHALRNALAPLVTLLGMDLGVLMGGAIVTEYIFSWPGLGREVLQAVLDVDLPVIIGTVIVVAVAIAIANVLTDIAYAILDPRVRLGSQKR